VQIFLRDYEMGVIPVIPAEKMKILAYFVYD
jgi:hypothetical protein